MRAGRAERRGRRSAWIAGGGARGAGGRSAWIADGGARGADVVSLKALPRATVTV